MGAKHKIMTKLEKKQAIIDQYPAGSDVTASMTVNKIGRDYITCMEIMGYTHYIRYTIEEFYSNFIYD